MKNAENKNKEEAIKETTTQTLEEKKKKNSYTRHAEQNIFSYTHANYITWYASNEIHMQTDPEHISFFFFFCS